MALFANLMSDMEDELVAATGTHDFMWATSGTIFAVDLTFGHESIEDGNFIEEDNQGALALVHNPITHQRTKHIDVAYHFSRERAECGDVTIRYIATRDQVADSMTKVLPREPFERHRASLGVYSTSTSHSA